MTITRAWAMPNKNTFSIKPIRELVDRYTADRVLIVDPFANTCTIAHLTNDLDPDMPTNYHMDAIDFLKMIPDGEVDCVLYDPPYSSRQVSDCYKRLGKTVTWETTQNSYWRKHNDEIARICKDGAIVISCGWNSQGVGKKRGFEIVEILLVAHGSHSNDTIITVERKLNQSEGSEI